MDGDEVRAASRVGATDAATWTPKLPLLCARPGNVGVQIDSYRAMKVFHRPRCGKFTAHFLGISFETSSMDNYARVVERTSKRARIVEDRLARLRARQQEILDDSERRQHRRCEREAARQRKIWLHHQSLKKREQRQREEMAAIVIQRCTRGMLGRRERDLRVYESERDHAAQTLQRSFRAFLRRKRVARRVLERQKERQMQAATVLQRLARKRFALASRKQPKKLDALESPHHTAFDASKAPLTPAEALEAEQAVSLGEGNAASPKIARAISLDLLFSDSEEDEPSTPTSPFSPLLAPLSMHTAVPAAARMSPRCPQQPRRPVSIKRVGGGFRATAFAAAKSPVARRHAARPQRPIRRPADALPAASRLVPSLLAHRVCRRPSVPAAAACSSSTSSSSTSSSTSTSTSSTSTSSASDPQRS